MINLYYAEDDEAIARAVTEYFSQYGYQVRVFSTVSEIQTALLAQQPHLVLIDWNMPDGQGDRLCRWIRSYWEGLPIIFLTVRNDSGDMVSAFSNGADDYVVKPFDLEVLLSRVRALLRRSGQGKTSSFFCGGLTLDMEKSSVFCHQEEIFLSQPEYQILLLLMQNKGKTVTRRQLLQQVWDSNGNYVNDNTLTVAVKRLREKLHNPSCIKTIRSFGYRMEDDAL